MSAPAMSTAAPHIPDEVRVMAARWRAKEAERAIIVTPVKCTALALWQREVLAGRHGQRADTIGSWRLDWLWRAACWEATAVRSASRGDLDHARECWLRARHEHEATP